jgi:uncharacterized membrane protein
MEIILLVITIFPMITALILRGKYWLLALSLALINLISILAIKKYESGVSPRYLTFSTLNIIFACVIWYIAFRPKNVLDSNQNIGTKKMLSTSGKVIALVIIIIILGFFGLIWVYLSGLPSLNGK